MRRCFAWLCLAAFVWMVGCRSPESNRADKAALLPDPIPTEIDYVDSDGFDRVLEAALVSKDPVIRIRTGRETADWDGRLNAWIAAWNGGNRRGRTVRGQAPPTPNVALDADSIRELRLLVESLFERIDDLALTGSSWYRDARLRARKVELLQDYNLRFHKSGDETIDLVFFHKVRAAYYPRFVQQLTQSDSPSGEWSRSVECSRRADASKARDRLTGGR